MPEFSRLVRFIAEDGLTYYGDAILPTGETNISGARKARVIDGDIFGSHAVTDRVLNIRELVMPLSPTEVGTVRCVGLNYGSHAAEAKMSIPKYPLLFYKPRTSLGGPGDKIRIPHMAQEGPSVDYECELVVVIGKKCRDATEANALDHVLGYAVGNDVTQREWQLQWGEGQWSHGKGFDTWGPIGPGIVTTQVITNPQNLKIWTRVNGELLQESNTAEMLFTVQKLISLLSRGVTLMPGDIIFTGTLPGVGMCRSPQIWLKDGDLVEVGLEGVGTCLNTVNFE